MAKQMFLIPRTRLVRVEYNLDGTKYSATIPRPASNDAMRVALLNKGIPWSVAINNVCGVYPVNEHSPPNMKTALPKSMQDWLRQLPVTIAPPNWENTPEAKLAEVNITELDPNSNQWN